MNQRQCCCLLLLVFYSAGAALGSDKTPAGTPVDFGDSLKRVLSAAEQGFFTVKGVDDLKLLDTMTTRAWLTGSERCSLLIDRTYFGRVIRAYVCQMQHGRNKDALVRGVYPKLVDRITQLTGLEPQRDVNNSDLSIETLFTGSKVYDLRVGVYRSSDKWSLEIMLEPKVRAYVEGGPDRVAYAQDSTSRQSGTAQTQTSTLPQSVVVGRSSGLPQLTITNSTPYSLHISFNGTANISLEVAPGTSQTVMLAEGNYRVQAVAASAGVSPLSGVESYKTGTAYQVTYTVVSR